ncbi:cytochrome c3 family protein [Ferrimonas senticii]|uniref:cytochrome c3 family protein n=1 Tax=Ferrimonas senticii TaxID=394566 RepID=UPI0004870A9B|nr:cytochrome c3 family protein [Ferrimonas senticii]
MKILIVILLASFNVFAIDGCNECHDEKWQLTPAHVWIDTEEHLEAVSCMDCHRWQDGKDLPPVLPSNSALQKDCGVCHHSPKDLATQMEMEQYQQEPDPQ